ncbi:MAG: hypothetical protein AAFY65_17165 [Pseudomonadota bacterium]
MPVITKRADIDKLPGGPTPAEAALLAACAAGEECVLGDGELPPEDAGPDRVIRAEVLRYLILGGSAGWRGGGSDFLEPMCRDGSTCRTKQLAERLI